MTLKEDYVSFEIAKLLKEKGFDWDCITYYVDSEPNDVKYSMLFENNTTWEKRCYSAPTHQMAMKWLREIHHLHINVGFGNDYKGEFLYMGDIYDLTNDAIHAKYKPIIEADDYLSDNPKTYEEAVETAIKYSLENLI